MENNELKKANESLQSNRKVSLICSGLGALFLILLYSVFQGVINIGVETLYLGVGALYLFVFGGPLFSVIGLFSGIKYFLKRRKLVIVDPDVGFLYRMYGIFIALSIIVDIVVLLVNIPILMIFTGLIPLNVW